MYTLNNNDDLLLLTYAFVYSGVLSPRRSLLEEYLEKEQMSIEQMIEEVRKESEEVDKVKIDENAQRIQIAKTYGYAVKFEGSDDDEDNNDSNSDNNHVDDNNVDDNVHSDNSSHSGEEGEIE